MTDITVKLDPGTGAATIELRDASVAEARFRLRDAATEKFLTRRGWSKTASYLPGEAVTVADFTVIALDRDLVRRIPASASLVLEQPASNLFASLSWPAATATVAAIAPIAEDEVTPAEPEEISPADDAVSLSPQLPAETGTEDPAPERDDEMPQSLEPSIRDEAIIGHVDDPVSSARPAALAGADVDDGDHGRPWGQLAAAALLFMLLGSVLTYFWQSSAYENELRTAMRAVEAQRDEMKAEFEKRSAESEAASDPGTAQNAELTRDRDAALAEVSEQQAKVKTLEERLSTAQGEIESLKAAAEADAGEQSAVFNQRIEALGKELDAARSELEAGRTQLAGRDQTSARMTEDLRKANEEIARLKASADDRQSATGQAEARIAELTAQLDKSQQELARRDQTLRDVQSRLSVANVQIEALKQVAGNATQADLERGTLADRITELTAQIDKADSELAARTDELNKVKTSLDAANALLATRDGEIERLKTASAAAPGGNAPVTADAERLKQERDLYARELTAMTESFNALKAERDRLAAGGDPERQSASIEAASGADSRAVWGATAIDQAGAIYSLQNQTAEKSASDNVVALCRGKSNGRCEALRTFSNSCFSLARIEGEGPRNDNFGFSVDRNWKNAESSALRQCKQLGANCTIRLTACSPDRLSKPAANQ